MKSSAGWCFPVLLGALVPASGLPAQSARFAPMSKDTLPSILGEPLVGDIDGDGDGDVIVVGYGLKAAALYLNTGDLQFVDASSRLPGALTGGRLVDLDGDGDLDVLGVGDVPLRPTVVWTNAGGGTFVDNSATAGAEFGLPVDVDGDGDLDIVSQRILRNDGSNRFTPDPRPFPGSPGFVAAGDIERDGDLDLVVVVGAGAGDRLLTNDGSGFFTDATVGRLPALGFARAAAFVDVDADGDLDLVTANQEAPGWRLALNRGTGVFTLAPGSALPVAANTLTIAAGDLDADGDADLFATVGTTAGVSPRILRNDGTGRFTVAPSAWVDPAAVGRPGFADIDGDGLADVAIGDGLEPLQLLMRIRTGGFWSANPRRVLGYSATEPFADFDGDGLIDLLRHLNDGRGGWRPFVLRNEGNGYLTSAGDAGAPLPVGAGDIDGDGDVDLVATQPGGAWETYQNDGRGNLTRLQAGTSCASQLLIGLVLLDVDRDGDLDLVAQSHQCISVAANDGTGRMTPVSTQAIPGASNATFADVDRDGLPEMLTQDRLYGTTGNGAFGDISHRLVGLPGAPTGLWPAGVDDLVTQVVGAVVLLKRSGAQWIASQTLATPVRRVRTIDLDGDGAREVLVFVGSAGAGAWLVFARNSLGTYVDSTAAFSLSAGDVNVFGAVDVDGDGDRDIVLIDRHVEVLLDRTTQIHAPLPARLGRMYRLDVWARRPSWGTHSRDVGVLAFIGLTRVRLPLPGIGTLAVDPATAVLLPAALIPWNSPVPRVTITGILPNVPALRGLPLWSQALLGWHGGLSLTGLERDVIR